MGSYIPSSTDERRQMLETVGAASIEDLFAVIPEEVRIKALNLPDGKSELETRRAIEHTAAKNTVFPSIFRGAGAYHHFIPAIVGSVVSKEQFVTAYTPYQAEISQGILQSIFEYQSMICRLTGMDVSNASVYDGASAAAEAINMCRDNKRNRALVSSAINPMVLDTIKTYCFGNGIEVELVPVKNGKTDLSALSGCIGGGDCCVYIQQPNFYGIIEDAGNIGEEAHKAGAKFIMGVYPIATAILKTPAECGADIACGEGQPLGMPLSFGGPYLGFMAAKAELARKLPGRIVGETVDVEGKRAFVLTLQAREQHIRREKASSNICSNEALCALTAAVYIAAMGDNGMKLAAETCWANGHYLASELDKIGFKQKYNTIFFNEFVTECATDVEKLMKALAAKGILGGLPLPDGGILWCATEMNGKDEIDRLIDVIKETK